MAQVPLTPAQVYALKMILRTSRQWRLGCIFNFLFSTFSYTNRISLKCENTSEERETAVAQWLRRCATNREDAGSIPAGVSGFFFDIKSFRSYYRPGVDSTSNRNEYQEYFLGVKAAGA